MTTAPVRPSNNGDDDHWQEQALCARTDPELFFTQKGETSKRRYAKLICKHCRVTAECLEDALQRNEIVGIWGGLTASERRGMKPKKDSK